MQITIQVKSNSLGDSVFDISGDTNIAGTKHQQAEIASLLSEAIHAVCSIYSVPKGLVKLDDHVPRSLREPTNRADRTDNRNKALAELENIPEEVENVVEYSEEEVQNALQIVHLLKGLVSNE